MTTFDEGTVLSSVAIFPLPQVVLFPGAMMPLHIFEPRYRKMTRDALDSSSRLLSVALIPEDHGLDARRQPDIATIAGVGEIVHHEELGDGRYNILVHGKARARVEELATDEPYRRARLTVLGTTARDCEADLRALRAAAMEFSRRVRQCHPEFGFSLPEDCAPGAIADVCAHYLVLDGEQRQLLLETLDDAERVRRCLTALMQQQVEMGLDDMLH